MTIEYITFGIIDNLVMIIGAMTGTSDWLGGAVAGNMGMANGTAVGCLIGLGFIPAILLIKNLRKAKQASK